MGWIAILLYIGGVILVLAEFLVPGGVCGILGGIFIVVSCVLGCMVWPEGAVFVIVGEVVGLAISVVAGMHFLPKSRVGKSLILTDSQDAAAGYVAAETNEALVGQLAKVLTTLRPAGMIVAEGKRVDAVSDGEFIDQDATVRIIEVRGSRVVVERAEPDQGEPNG